MLGKLLRARRRLGWFYSAKFSVAYLVGLQKVRLRVPGVRTPLWLRPRDRDYSVLYQIFDARECDVPLPSAPGAIIDGGAHVGYATLFFANRYPGSRILAVEPAREHLALLRANTSAYPKVEVVPAAIWSHTTELALVDPREGSWALRVQEAPAETTVRVPAVTISTLIDRLGVETVDVLKLDIEGAEREVFTRGVREWLPRIRTLIIETHGEECRKAVLAAFAGERVALSERGEKLVVQRG